MAEQLGDGQRPAERGGEKPEGLARRMVGADDQIVGVDGKPCMAAPLFGIGKQDAGPRIGGTEILGFDAAGSVADRQRNQRHEVLGQVGTAGRHVERGGQIAEMVVDRRRSARQQRVLGKDRQ